MTQTQGVTGEAAVAAAGGARLVVVAVFEAQIRSRTLAHAVIQAQAVQVTVLIADILVVNPDDVEHAGQRGGKRVLASDVPRLRVHVAGLVGLGAGPASVNRRRPEAVVGADQPGSQPVRP